MARAFSTRKAGGTEVMHDREIKGAQRRLQTHVSLASGDQRRSSDGRATRKSKMFSAKRSRVAGLWRWAAADLDGDLLPEIYIANDFGPDRLLHNRSTPGNLKFALLEGTTRLH